MREWQGDIWECLDVGYVVVVPVNLQGYMGRGLALQASQRFEGLQAQFRAWCQKQSTKPDVDEVFVWYDGDDERIILAPTKKRYSQKANLGYVEFCFWLLSQWPSENNIAVPPLGCGFGGLEFSEVRALAEKWLTSDRFLFVTPASYVRSRYPDSFQPARTGTDVWQWDNQGVQH